MTVLVPGGNAPIPNGDLTVTVTYSPIDGADIDVSAFQLTSTGKVRGDNDMCFYGQPSVSAGALRLAESAPGCAVFALNPNGIEASIEKIALTATIYENRAKFATCSNLALKVVGAPGGEQIDAPITTAGMQETALILGEFYRRNGQWKFRLVAQGFAGGLEPLAKNFGVEIAAPAPTPTPAATPKPAPAPAPAPSKINLNKITLDKNTASISLEKKADFGEIKINLNWNRGSSGGFLSFGKSSSIDLDLGCLFEMQDGVKGCVQALGNCFGNYRNDPYIELMGDDRTGAVTDGEWLRINGAQWKDMKRILVFAFIYEGAPNWKSTDGIVTLYAPGQPPIEVRLNEEGGRHGVCAIAMLENVNGTVKVSREVQFFKGHEKLDRAYNWGMRWSAGSK
jgi:tellurite resistance protein TerA